MVGQNNLFKTKIMTPLGEFWEKFLKIFEKMAKEIHLFAEIFEKNSKRDTHLLNLDFF